jgi:hypothetical protein
MKKILLTLVLLCTVLGFAQQGKIYPKNKKIKQGEVNTYIYEPPAGLEIPENSWAVGQSDSFEVVSSPLVKKDSNYEFLMKFSGKTNMVLIKINNQKSKTVDNNNYKGYEIKLNSKYTDDEMQLTKITFWGFTAFDLGEEKYMQMQIDAYKEIMNSNSKKKDDAYFNYLYTSYWINPDSYKTELLKYLERNTGRTFYIEACNVLKRLKKMGADKHVNFLINHFKTQYAKRPALLEELKKV